MKARLAAPATGSPALRAAGSATVPRLASVIGNRGRARGGPASHPARAHGSGLGAAALHASAARGVATPGSALPRAGLTQPAFGRHEMAAPPVQRRADPAAAADPGPVHQAAAQGVATATSLLPHGDAIQRAFGRHDISSVQAHTGREAAASARAMGAEAYATGDHVVLGDGATDLHTIAHEAAHVVQQRAGVQLEGGVGEAGDPYERHADEVADRVVQGKSAESLLDAMGPARGAAPAGSVQRTGERPRARVQPWRARLLALRLLIANQERDPEKFDAAAARSEIDAALDAALSGITGDERAARVEEIRSYVDSLPDYFGDHIVNAVHARIDKRGPQIGIPGVGYLPPGKTTDLKGREHIASRGIAEVVRIEGTWYAPVYQTVFGDAFAPGAPQYEGGGPKYKDASQGAGGQVELHSGGGAGSDVVYWCSIGRPLRQLKWMNKYALDPNAKEPLIRSFLIPLEVANAISGEAVTEHLTSGMNLDLIVDKHYERNQFGIVSRASFESLRELALPGSLRTYTDGSIVGRPEAWGEVRPASELRERVGVPQKPIPGFDVVVDTRSEDKGFTKKDDYPKQADDLMRIHAYYTDNAEFLPTAQSMPSESERKQEVHAFFLQHKPTELDDDARGLATFMSEYVAPWATQARIAQEISEDYDIVSSEENLAGIITSPDPVYFAGTTARPLRGQRRPGAVAQSKDQQALLAERDRLLVAAKAASESIPKVFKNHGVPPGDLPRLLHQLKVKLGEFPNNYDFYIGRVEVVAAKLPEYRKVISKAIEDITKALPTNAMAPYAGTALIHEILTLLRTVTT